MKRIAHRGWSAGPSENSLAALARAAADPRIDGVELDVRRAPDGTLVLAHDPLPPGAAAPALDAALAVLAGTRLDVLLELKEPGLAAGAGGALRDAGLGERGVVFGFPEVMLAGADRAPPPVRTGVIVPQPWHTARLVRAVRPDVLLLGWDERAWTRAAFRAWWSVFSLRRLARRTGTALVVGVVRREGDLGWLERRGADAAVIDMAPVAGAA